MRLRYYWIAAVLALSGLQTNIARAAIYVSGRVFYQKTGAALPAATLSLFTPGATDPTVETQSLSNGTYVFMAPEAGKYQLRVSLGSMLLLNEPLTIPATGIASLNVAVRHGSQIRMKLTDANGKPVTTEDVQAWILVAQDKGATLAQGCTVTQTPTEAGLLEVEAPRSLPLSSNGEMGIGIRAVPGGCAIVYLKEWPDDPIPIHLQPGVTLYGQVQNRFGTPRSGARVMVTGMAANFAARFLQGWETTQTDDNGNFEVPDLVPGRYNVEARSLFEVARPVDLTAKTPVVELPLDMARGMPASFMPPGVGGYAIMRRARVPNGRLNRFEPFLVPLPDAHLAPGPARPPVPISGIALANGKPVQNNTLALYRPGYELPLDYTETDANGAFTLQAPAPGSYEVGDYGGLYVPTAPSIRAPNPAGAPIRLMMEVHPSLSIRLIGPDNKPVNLVQASLRLNWGRATSAVSVSLRPSPEGVIEIASPGERSPLAASQVILAVRTFLGSSAELQLARWPTEPVTLHLGPGSTLTGSVTDANGKVVPGVIVAAYLLTPMPDGSREYDPMGQETGRTGPDGLFKITGLLPGLYYVAANVGEEGVHSRLVNVKGNQVDTKLGAEDRVMPGATLHPNIVVNDGG